jgi:hypothetical protein
LRRKNKAALPTKKVMGLFCLEAAPTERKIATEFFPFCTFTSLKQLRPYRTQKKY